MGAPQAKRRGRRGRRRAPEPDRYRRLSPWLKARYGQKVYKVSLRGDFTCPNRDGVRGRGGCTFCSLEALEPSGYDPTADVTRQLETQIRHVRARHKAERYLAYFQDYTATYGDPERLRRFYEPAIAPPEVVGLAVGTRPDCVPGPVLDLLGELAGRTDVYVELGIQVASDAVLDAVNRCHTVAEFADAVRRCQARGLRVCAHAILGLPGATPADELRTADLLSDLGVWGAKVHSLHVIRGTPMGKDYLAGGFRTISQAAYVDRAVAFLERLDPAIVVHRLTGEAPRDLTLAPAWTLNKLAVLNAIDATLRARATWQGRLRGAGLGALATRG